MRFGRPGVASEGQNASTGLKTGFAEVCSQGAVD